MMPASICVRYMNFIKNICITDTLLNQICSVPSPFINEIPFCLFFTCAFVWVTVQNMGKRCTRLVVCSGLPGIHGKSAGSVVGLGACWRNQRRWRQGSVSSAGKKSKGAASCPGGIQPFEGQGARGGQRSCRPCVRENSVFKKVGEQIPFPAMCYHSFQHAFANLFAIFLLFVLRTHQNNVVV